MADDVAETAARSVVPRSGNYPAVAGQAVSASVATQFSAVAVVLPFVCIALGGPVLAATLIFPAYTIAWLAGTTLTPLLVTSERPSKAMLTAAVAGTAALMFVNALGAEFLGDAVGVGFVLTGAALGLLTAVAGVCFVDVIADVLHPHEQGRLLVVRRIVSSVIVFGIATADMLLFGNRGGAPAHERLLWFGAIAMAASATCCLLIDVEESRRKAERGPQPRATVRSVWHMGVRLGRDESWFRRLLVVQTVFLSLSLGATFYSAHGATLHGDAEGSLHLILASSAVGLVLFGGLWKPLQHRLTVRRMYLLAGGLGVGAAALCIVADRWATADTRWIYGAIMAFVAVATMAVGTAQGVWLLRRVADDRLLIISFTRLVGGVAAALVAAGLGVLAHLHGVIWPVYCMVGLTIIALGATRWVPPLPIVHPAAHSER